MSKDEILSSLRRAEPELKEAGLVHLRLFGSAARGEASSQSDVDLMAEFDSAEKLTLVTLGSLENRLGELVGSRVDLSPAAWMRESIRDKAMQESLLAF